MKKSFYFLFILFLLVAVVSTSAYAHPGDTDENGGHVDQSSDEYHYHHGYPEHSHYDMDGDGDIDCPYDFVDKTGQNSSDQKTMENDSNDGMGILDKIFYFVLILVLSLFLIPYIFYIPINWLSVKSKNPDTASLIYYVIFLVVINAVSAVIIFKQ